jgi:pimeloyl-ACP methyl ester carboxylesterase
MAVPANAETARHSRRAERTHPGLVGGPIYLDYNATTPVDPRVAEAALPYLTHHFGNPSSGHRYADQPRAALAAARTQVANLICAEPDNVVFTGSGTEADALAIQGAVHAADGRHMISQTTEHPAVLGACATLSRRHGIETTYLPVNAYGLVNPDDLRAALAQPRSLVSIMYSAGRGWSDPADGPQDGAHIAADLHTLLDRAHVPDPYVLAGHSFGGLYMLSFAAQFPDQVAGMVLLASTAPKPGPAQPTNNQSDSFVSRVSALLPGRPHRSRTPGRPALFRHSSATRAGRGACQLLDRPAPRQLHRGISRRLRLGSPGGVPDRPRR